MSVLLAIVKTMIAAVAIKDDDAALVHFTAD